MTASRTSRARRRSDADGNLFPFLGILLCIIGVLAFLQILMATMTSRRVELRGRQASAWQIAVQAFVDPDGLLVVAPSSPPPELMGALDEDTRRAVAHIFEARRARLDILRERHTRNARPTAAFDADALAAQLDEMRRLNMAALRHGVLYEEFVLIGVFPGGGATYAAMREVLNQTEYNNLRVGLEPLDDNFQLALGELAGG